jgi:hypothetical protein
MMSMTLTTRDRAALAGVHPDLVRVVERAADLSPVPFRVIEGLRSIEQQARNVERGVSWTMNSRHIKAANGVGHAVDLVLAFDVDGDGDVDGSDYWANPASASGGAAWRRLETAVKKAAGELGVPVEWGGDWRSSKDYPHWQLPWKSYPADRPVGAAPIALPAAATAGTYRLGAKADRVLVYQKALHRLGYSIPLTGTFDDRTDFVIRVVQRQNGLDVDGVLGPRTMTAIDAMVAAAARGEPAGVEMVNAAKEPPAAAEPVAEETDQAAAKKQAVMVGGGGAVAGAGMAADGIGQAIDAVERGRSIFTPGTVLFTLAGVVVVGLLLWQAYRVMKRAGALPKWAGGA